MAPGAAGQPSPQDQGAGGGMNAFARDHATRTCASSRPGRAVARYSRRAGVGALARHENTCVTMLELGHLNL
jgi:hypothetical protein